jgi:GxxExxY protein
MSAGMLGADWRILPDGGTLARMNTPLPPPPGGEFLFKEITKEIIGAAFEVHRHLGYGYLERVYQRALQVELRLRGLQAESEHAVSVHYKGTVVGEYAADLWVEGKVAVELKVAPEYRSADEAQLINELVSTGAKVGLPIDFGRQQVQFKRLAN